MAPIQPIFNTFSVLDERGGIVALIQVVSRPALMTTPLGRRGHLWPYRIVKGRYGLLCQWRRLATLRLRAANGREARVQIATFPPHRDGTGFIQFI